MRAHGIIDELEERGPVIAAPFFVLDGLKSPQIGDEVRFPDAPFFYFGDISSALAPFIGAAAVTIRENKTIIKNVVEVAIAIDNHRRVSQGNHPHRRTALSIEMLMPSVERRGEETSLLPLERVLLAAFIPDRRRALALENENRLFIHGPHRFELSAGRDFLDPRIARAAGAVPVDDRRLAAGARPIANLQLQQIGNDEIFIYRNSFPLLIDVVRTLS